MKLLPWKLPVVWGLLVLLNTAACDSPLSGGTPPFARTQGFVLALAFAPDGQTLAVATQGEGAQIRQVPSGILLRTLHPDLRTLHPDPGAATIVRSLTFTPDGKNLLIGATREPTPFAELWSVADGQLLKSWAGQNPVAVSPDGRVLAVTAGGELQLWTLDALTATQRLRVDGDPLMSAAFSPDGQQIALGTPFDLFLWRTSDGSQVQKLSSWASQVVFTPNGQLLAAPAAVNGEIVKLWRVADGQVLRTLTPPGGAGKGQIHALAISPDGRILAAGGNNQQLRLWRIADGALLQTQSFDATIDALAFSPDSRTLAVGEYQRVQLWTVPALPAAPLTSPTP